MGLIWTRMQVMLSVPQPVWSILSMEGGQILSNKFSTTLESLNCWFPLSGLPFFIFTTCSFTKSIPYYDVTQSQMPSHATNMYSFLFVSVSTFTSGKAVTIWSSAFT